MAQSVPNKKCNEKENEGRWTGLTTTATTTGYDSGRDSRKSGDRFFYSTSSGVVGGHKQKF
jgi:hypothetical protein